MIELGLKFTFLLYWLIVSPFFVWTETRHGSRIFWIGLGISFLMDILILNSFKYENYPHLSTIAVCLISALLMPWFIWITIQDAQSVFTPIKCLTIFFVFIDMISFTFCLNQIWGLFDGVYITNQIINHVDTIPIYLKTCNQ